MVPAIPIAGERLQHIPGWSGLMRVEAPSANPGRLAPVREQSDQPRYPRWVTGSNRVLTSRLFVFGAAGLFAIDGVARLVDGRILRGLANLAVAVVLILTRGSVARRARGEIPSDKRKRERLDKHPIVSSITMGLAWGAAM